MPRPSLAFVLVSFLLASCGGGGEGGTPSEGDPPQRATSPEAALEGWIRAEYGHHGRIGYRAAETDLDGDGAPEVVVHVGGSGICGPDGCNLVVLERSGDGFRKVSETSVTRLPMGQLDSQSNGWADMWVTVDEPGELTARRILRFDGASYPSVHDAATDGHVEVLNPLVLIPEGELIWLD